MAESVPQRALRNSASVHEMWLSVWTLNFPEPPRRPWEAQPNSAQPGSQGGGFRPGFQTPAASSGQKFMNFKIANRERWGENQAQEVEAVRKGLTGRSPRPERLKAEFYEERIGLHAHVCGKTILMRKA